MASKILVGTDDSDQSIKAFDHAVDLAINHRAQLHAATVVFGADIEMAEPEEREALIERASERARMRLAELEARADAAGVSLTTHLLKGQPAESLLELARRERVGHIVVGHRSKGLFERLLMGSVAKRVVDFAHCSVTVVR